ncbi:MAG: hypothetical protein LBB51_04855 [Zoogloeaceae bacterium]|nr:hypothetical protein [Zoogloeaceae bacterium]
MTKRRVNFIHFVIARRAAPWLFQRAQSALAGTLEKPLAYGSRNDEGQKEAAKEGSGKKQGFTF